MTSAISPAPFAGAGWLIGEDLIVTNRHVAQLFVDFLAAGGPQIRPERDPHIDFGHEYRGRESVGRRPVIDLVFSGAMPIPTEGINHSLLDMAVSPGRAGSAGASPGGVARWPRRTTWRWSRQAPE
ncbi:hypothetical protein [Devosia sp.]|uniref:hypothetical protein n=1 Tax=Devosia sp. TaxID=1871048 RepID=UPI00260675A8|nr:hypothetical protein [Devosia sp.]